MKTKHEIEKTRILNTVKMLTNVGRHLEASNLFDKHFPNFLIKQFLFSFRIYPMTYSNNPNIKRVKVYSGRNKNRMWINATVFIIGLSSLLLAGYLTNKGFEKCLQAGNFTYTECEKKHYG